MNTPEGQLGFREIAAALHISVSMAHNAYETGMKKLRKQPDAMEVLKAIIAAQHTRQIGNDLSRQYTRSVEYQDSNARWDEADVAVTAVVRERDYTEMSEVGE